jgi:hypothetical protein
MLAVTMEKQSNLVGHNLKEQENSYSKNEQASFARRKETCYSVCCKIGVKMTVFN